MICLECGAQVRSINFKHLKSCCGLTPGEYRERHPGAPLLDEDVRLSIGMPGESNPNWRGGRTIKHCECGKRLSRSNRSGLCISCSRKGERNPFHGREHSGDTRLRMKESNRHRDPATYRGGGADPAVLSERRRQEWARRSPEEKERHLASFIAAGQVHNRRSTGTKIETTVAGILEDLGVQFSQNTQIGRHNVDFLVGRTIIECFGDFWHCNPVLWKAGDYNASLRMTAGDKWAKDAKRREELESKGFRFLALWEADIRQDPDSIRGLLTTLLTERGNDAAEA